MQPNYQHNWADLAFASKKPINGLGATFIAAPREISSKRLAQLVKDYLPAGNIVLGVAREAYVAGFEDQPQFKMFSLKAAEKLLAAVNSSPQKQKVYTLAYSQRDFEYVLDKLDFRRVVLVNGSWKYAFHTQKPYYVLAQKKCAIDMVSPFADEAEARTYERRAMKEIASATQLAKNGSKQTELQMLQLARSAAKYSFDYNFQTGASLGKKVTKDTYTFMAASYNKVVPYQTYAMHCGASREKHFAPPHDLNHYDTIHAEVAMIISAAETRISLSGTTLFINLLPCPPCSRMLSQTQVDEVVYTEDHSGGYAVRMLELAGKKVRRVV